MRLACKGVQLGGFSILASESMKSMGNQVGASEATLPVGAVLVVGGGIGRGPGGPGSRELGILHLLVEKSPAIGGVMAQLDKTFPTNDCSMCILSPKLVECARHPNIEVLTLTEVQAVGGEARGFQVWVSRPPRYIDMERCIAWASALRRCRGRVTDEFNTGLGVRKSAYLKYPQAVPLKYAIDAASCIALTKARENVRLARSLPRWCCPSRRSRWRPAPHVGAIISRPG